MRFDQWLTELVCDEKRGEFGSWRKERNCWQNWAGFMQLPHFRMVFAMTRSVAAFPSISEVGGKREIMSVLMGFVVLLACFVALLLSVGFTVFPLSVGLTVIP